MHQLLVAQDALTTLFHHMDVPNFGGGEAPPGSDKLLKVGRWVLWIVSAVCVIGILLVGGKLAVQHSHGEAATHGKAFGAVIAGCILVGTASGIAAALI